MTILPKKPRKTDQKKHQLFPRITAIMLNTPFLTI